MARLQRARALVLSGEAAVARTAYEDLLALWQAADADAGLVTRARTEYADLQESEGAPAAIRQQR
jgi:hypothetical protein